MYLDLNKDEKNNANYIIDRINYISSYDIY